MKEYNIAIIAGIFAIVAALVPIILSKRKREKIGSSKNSHTDQLKIEASAKLFELTSGLVKLTTDDFRPVKKGYLKEVKGKYDELVDFFNSKEYLFNDDIIRTVKSIKEIIHKAIKLMESLETYRFQGLLKYIENEQKALEEFFIDQMQKELPLLRENLKELIRK
ncbi:MAG: hypothetical protein JNL03_01355 [Prolixibacteraceae bacterium]|nr:hypothetical protein [Prolixibacteraceae bacterium]